MLFPLVLAALLVATVTLILTAIQQPELVGWALDTGSLSLASVGPSVSTALRRRRGRPRKFAAPSRAVTLTLPESVIAALSRIHDDLSRAIVGLTQRHAPARTGSPAELVVFGRNAVISIRPTPALERRADLHLVPLPNGRALISFDTPKTLADLELTLDDALEDATLSGEDRNVFQGISEILKEARRSKDVTLIRRHIVVLESTPAPRRRDASPSLPRSRKA